MAKAIAQSNFVGTVTSAPSLSTHSVVDYSKFDNLDIGSDDEDGSRKGKPSRARLRYELMAQRNAAKAAALRGEGYEEAELDASKRLKEAGFGDEVDESSSEDDSDIESIPLFWKKLPKNWRENETIKAMQSLKDETPLDELAEDMKEQGNEWYKKVLDEKPTGTRLLTYQRNALRCYTTGLNYAHNAEATAEMRQLHATLLVNRAAVQLARKNYRKVIRDCRGALRFDGLNLKAHYRAAQALLKLKRYDEAQVHADEAAKLVEPGKKNKALAKCQRGIARGIKQRDEERAAKEKKESAERDMMQKIQRGCLERGIRMGPCLMRLGMEQRSVRPKVFGIVGGGHGMLGQMAWPVMFLYEEHAQHDFIQQVGDDTSLRDLVEMVLPEKSSNSMTPPWDEDEKYVCSNVELFFETRCVPAFQNDEPWPTNFPVQTEAEAAKGRLREWVQVPMGLTLIDVLTFPEYVVPQVVTFHVVPKSGSFHKEFLRRNKDKLRKLMTKEEVDAATAAARAAAAAKMVQGVKAPSTGSFKPPAQRSDANGKIQASPKTKAKKKKKKKSKKKAKQMLDVTDIQGSSGLEEAESAGEAVPSSDLD